MCGANHTMPLMPSTIPASFFSGMGSSNSRKPPARMITVFMWPTCNPTGVSPRKSMHRACTAAKRACDSADGARSHRTWCCRP